MTSSVYPYDHTEVRLCQIAGLKPEALRAAQVMLLTVNGPVMAVAQISTLNVAAEM